MIKLFKMAAFSRRLLTAISPTRSRGIRPGRQV